MLVSGSNNLYNHYPEIDALNVFPVPDGDTGMNMNLTCASGSKEILNRNDDDVYVIASTFSKGLLMGARGNSGVITSQIFRGFSKGLEGLSTCNAQQFSDALEKGVEVVGSKLFRPPYGKIGPLQAKKLYSHLHVIMWDIITMDYDHSLSGEDCFQNVKNYVRNGSIIVFHDSPKSEKNLLYALPKTIEYLKKENYTFAPIQFEE